MLGTVVSMVAMFHGLDGAKSELGLQLSVAMTATFAGLFLSNALISPIADRLFIRHLGRRKELDSLLEILMFIHSREPVSFVREEITNRVA
jgi:flagellar motor component MotA